MQQDRNAVSMGVEELIGDLSDCAKINGKLAGCGRIELNRSDVLSSG